MTILKYCPFCEAESAKLVESNAWAAVECLQCGGRTGRKYFHQVGMVDAQQSAMADWNRLERKPRRDSVDISDWAMVT